MAKNTLQEETGRRGRKGKNAKDYGQTELLCEVKVSQANHSREDETQLRSRRS